MKKIFYSIIAATALLSLGSCGKFEVENTSTVELAGNWVCDVFVLGDEGWELYYGSEVITYNTAADDGKEIWVDDVEGFWGTKLRVPCDIKNLCFGKEGVEFEDQYNSVAQKLWGGKITLNGAVAPGTETVVDRIEFYVQFSDDDPLTYCFVGYRRTGYPEDDDNFVEDWEDMPSTDVPEWSFAE